MAKIRTEKNVSKKEVITKTAAALFKTKGYSSTSMRELAEAIGVEAPSLYNHIGSKSELLQAICFKMGNEFTAQTAKIKSSSGTASDKLRAIIRFHIEMMMHNFNELYVANHEWKHLDEPYLTDFLTIRRNYEKSLVSLIEQGIEKNELQAINPYVAVLTILSAVRGLEFWQRNKKNIPPQVLEEDMINHLLHGIVK
ncbi:MAG TPA: TetR/AcrR family transcriptional regulator [Ferruginibacter sp.]|nr:TetR/AcrR family transcriptional regulator [Ferruginibacter sp.]HMP20659.1 TetR/AcrR family transcriptional regulator [Ferruginibacter sp.]